MIATVGRVISICSVFFLAFFLVCSVSPLFAEEWGGANEDSLAQQLQNPLANLVSLPFQNNTGFNAGPDKGETNVLNIQPVLPFTLGDWNVISRVIIPLTYVPGFTTGLVQLPEGDDEDIAVGSQFGLGDINFTPFFSPVDSDSIVWGFGPSINMATATDSLLGSDKWSLGPSAVILAQPGNWTVGALARQLWSFAGSDNRDDVNQTLLQPFLAYGLGDGWTINSAPVLLANWEEESGNRWTIPLGGGIQKLVRLAGKLPLNIGVQAYANVERPEFAPEWELRTQLTFILPKFY